jgi:hypothetical protein
MIGGKGRGALNDEVHGRRRSNAEKDGRAARAENPAIVTVRRLATPLAIGMER